MISLQAAKLDGKRVLLRADFNVPIKDGVIQDDTRVQETLPTINFILNAGAKLIIMSHLGRPKGIDKSLSLAPVAKHLEKLLGQKVHMLDDCVGSSVSSGVNTMLKGEVALLENLRFHREEEANNESFARELASLADVYVNDAFAASHRAHASIALVPKLVKEIYAGFLLEKEIEYLTKLLESPDRPFAILLGGVKVSDKIPIIENLIKKVDAVIIGGAMAYTFLKSKGIATGNSIVENEHISKYSQFLNSNVRILLPVDHLCAKSLEDTQTKIFEGSIQDGFMGVDIGPKTIDLFKQELKKSKTIFWNGPLGAFEIENFSTGTKEIARFISGLDCTTVAGGGDTVSALEKFKLKDKIKHVSTGGGACLEFLEGKTLPGVKALLER